VASPIETALSVGIATLYTHPDNLEGHRLGLLITYKQCPCKIVTVTTEGPPEGFAVVNPGNYVPFFVDRNLALWSPDAIEQYLEERFPHPTLLPVDPKLRAQLRQMSYEFRSWYPIQHDRFALGALHEFAEILGDGPWVTGNTRTTADLAAFPFLWRWRTLLREAGPAVCRYFTRSAPLGAAAAEAET
jgi:glutathione S-transferase